MQKRTIVILWIGSVIIASLLGYGSSKSRLKVVKELVKSEAQVVYKDKVITIVKETVSPTGKPEKTTTTITDKSVVKKESEVKQVVKVDPKKDWAVTVDGSITGSIWGSGALERHVIGPFSIRLGLNANLRGPSDLVLTPFVGIRFEF